LVAGAASALPGRVPAASIDPKTDMPDAQTARSPFFLHAGRAFFRKMLQCTIFSRVRQADFASNRQVGKQHREQA
jgi:hypothetical protein